MAQFESHPLSLETCRVYTPPELAMAMVRAISKPDVQWLDPCVGEGAFPTALAKLGVQSGRIVAIDLNPIACETDRLTTPTRGVDFIAWARTQDRRFDSIVANPPFISLSRLSKRLRKAAISVPVGDMHPIRLGANYWCAFLCQSVNVLRPNGDICFLLPASWEYADYAASIRAHLPQQFERFEIHRSAEPLFTKVQEGSVVVVGRGYGRSHQEICYHQHADARALVMGLSDRPPQSPVSRIAPLNWQARQFREVSLGKVIEVRIGAVTGDSSYFLMNDQRRRELRLPVAAMSPVLSRARDLMAPTVGRRAWNKLRRLNARVWLFRPNSSVVTHSAVNAYLDLARSNGGCNRDAYHVLRREPWYLTTMSRRQDGFLSGMSRHGPWISLRAMPGLNATNTLYTVRFRKKLSPDQKAAWCLSLLTTTARQQLVRVGRRYPDGLIKYEPHDLEAVSIPQPPARKGATRAYGEAVKALLVGRVAEASQIADVWFAGEPMTAVLATRQGLGRRAV
jgi:adenine-specific DNA-methyltransferase